MKFEVKNYEALPKQNISKKTKIITIVILVSILMLIVIKIAAPFFILPSEIRELNKHINLPYKFGTSIEEFDIKTNEWKQYNRYNRITYYNDEDNFGFSGFPDLSCAYKFTKYATSKPGFSVFGIHIGDEVSEADKILKDYGYKLEEDDYRFALYKRGRVDITIGIKKVEPEIKTEYSLPNEIVDVISIMLHHTDWLLNGYYK